MPMALCASGKPSSASSAASYSLSASWMFPLSCAITPRSKWFSETRCSFSVGWWAQPAQSASARTAAALMDGGDTVFSKRGEQAAQDLRRVGPGRLGRGRGGARAPDAADLGVLLEHRHGADHLVLLV